MVTDVYVIKIQFSLDYLQQLCHSLNLVIHSQYSFRIGSTLHLDISSGYSPYKVVTSFSFLLTVSSIRLM